MTSIYPSESRIIDQISQELQRFGLSPARGIAPSGWEPDLLATDGRGTLLCVEVKTGDQPLHSGVLRTLSRAQDDLSSTWPGRSVVALLTTSPVSERLRSALASTGIIFLQFNGPREIPEVIAELVRLVRPGPNEPSSLEYVDLSLMNQAALAADEGRWEEARTLYKNILSSQIKVLGEAHPAVLDTRYRLASLTALTGDLAAALREYSDLLAKQVETLGPDRPSTLETRKNRADLLAQAGDSTAALSEYRDLLAAQTLIQGPEHPDVLATRR